MDRRAVQAFEKMPQKSKEHYMVNESIKKLLSIASAPLAFSHDAEGLLPKSLDCELLNELYWMLDVKNGFFAFESALHVFPRVECDGILTLKRWNENGAWKNEYDSLIPNGMVFFAQDAFGNQFGIDPTGVSIFYSEFAEIEPIAKNLNEWAELILNDWQGLTGYDLCHEWQVRNRSLREGERLIPKIPFVLGGKYTLDNLYVGDILKAQRFRGSLSRQIVDAPDGTKIDLKVL